MPRDTTRMPVRVKPGKPRADRDMSRPLPASVSWVTLTAFALAFAAATLTFDLPLWLAAAYGALSILSVIVYAIDKSAAKRNGQRVSEQTLLTLGFVGGWPGALIAQHMLRHKTRKRSFRRAFWASVAANIVLLGIAIAFIWA